MEIIKDDLKSLQENILQAMEDRSRIDNGILMREIKASEHRLKTYVDEKTEVVLTALSQTIDSDIQPKIKDHEQRLNKLETKTA